MWRPPPEERRCTDTARNGKPCKLWARRGTDKCTMHSVDGPRCTADVSGISHPENAGTRCRKPAEPGQDVCDKHGGKSPQAKSAAARRIVEAELMELAEDLVGAPVDNPLTELANLAGRSRAWMELLQKRVEKLLESGTDTEGEEGHNSGKSNGIRYQAGAGEQIRAEIQLYERAMDRLGKFLADFGRLRIDERLAKISERQADTVIGAIEAALNAAGVRDQTQRTAAKQAAARHLQLVS